MGDQSDELWLERFKRRAGRHEHVRDVAAHELDAPVLQDLRRSVGIFQVGESGDGTHLVRAAHLAGATDAYISSLRYFVIEEQEHARLLALVLDALDGPLRSRHWSARLFALIRRSRDLVTEILILLIAEVVAVTYYSALRDGVPGGDLRAVFERIHADEVVHVAFHSETLPRYLNARGRVPLSIMHVGWRTLLLGVATGVAISHGAILRTMNTSRRAFVGSVVRAGKGTAQRLFLPA